MKAFAFVAVVALAVFTVRADNPVTVSGVTYSYGVCQPSGSYTMNECCPLGYEVITTETECELAFNNMSPKEPGSTYGGLADRNQRPYGCYQYLGNMNFHFNSVVPGGTLFGDDLVICKSSTVDTCAAPTTHRGTSFPQDAFEVGGPAAAVELGGDFEIEGEFKVNTPADGKYKPILSRTIGTTYSNNNAQINIQVQANGNFNVFMSGSSIYEVNLNGGIMSANTWTHFRLSMVNNVASLYINGLRKGSDPFSGTRFLNGNGNPLEIGHYANAQQQYFDGEIRNVRVSTHCVVVAGPPPTHDPAVAAFCDDIQSKCTSMDSECTTLRSLNHIPVQSPNVLNPTNRHLYRLVTFSSSAQTFAQFRATAQAIGAGWDLATFTDIAELNFVKDNLVTPHYVSGTRAYTVGAYDTASGWKWIDGSSVAVSTFFGAGEPNGHSVPYPHAGMDNRYGFKFNDYVNDNYCVGGGCYLSGFVAEKHTAEPDSEIPDDCDATVVACNAIEQDCRDKAATCPLV